MVSAGKREEDPPSQIPTSRKVRVLKISEKGT